MKPQSGSTGLSQLFCTSVVRASLSLFFFITFSGVMMEWLLWQKHHKNKSISISLLRKDKLKNLLSLDQCKIKNCHLYTEDSSMGHFFFFYCYIHACKIHANHFRIVYAVDHSLLLKNIISNKLHTHTQKERSLKRTDLHISFVAWFLVYSHFLDKLQWIHFRLQIFLWNYSSNFAPKIGSPDTV